LTHISGDASIRKDRSPRNLSTPGSSRSGSHLLGAVRSMRRTWMIPAPRCFAWTGGYQRMVLGERLASPYTSVG